VLMLLSIRASDAKRRTKHTNIGSYLCAAENASQTATTLLLKARSFNEHLNYLQAIVLLKEAQELQHKLDNNLNQEIDIELAKSYLGQLNYDQALAYLLQAAEKKSTNVSTKASQLCVSATYLRLISKNQKAKHKCLEAIDLLKENRLAESSEYAECWLELSQVCIAEKNLANAKKYAQKAIDTAQNTFGTNAGKLVFYLNNMADVLSMQQEHQKAWDLRRQSLFLAKKFYGHDSKVTSVILRDSIDETRKLADQESRLGHIDQSKALIEEADATSKTLKPLLVKFGLQLPSIEQH